MFGTSAPVSDYAKSSLYYCDRAGYITDNPDFLIDRDSLDDYLLLYVVSGFFHMDIAGKKSTAVPGDTVVINLKEKHLYYSDKNDPCEILWIDFNCTDDKMSPVTSITSLPLVFPCRDNLEPMNEFVYQYVNNSRYAEIRQSQIIYGLLMSAVAWIKRGAEPEPSAIPEVEDYISGHIDEKITLSDLADVTHLSTYHFMHVFKKRYGVSPMRYVIGRKLNRASYLLTYSAMSVTQISEQLGFCSQSHFSALYKKHTGLFPSEYRKMNGSSGGDI
ncbi:MAG: AraC family transcriptional regulator [Eubacteriales bacterium]